ncbi:MAG: aminoacyl-tRNA deacylase [Planctomycetota bacterium]
MKVEDYLREQGVWFERHVHAPAYTAQELAAEEHMPGANVAKAVIVRADGEYVMVVLPASHKLDMRKLASALNCDACRLAEEEEMADLFPDVEIGSEPPMGNLYDIVTVVDARLAEDDQILFTAGSHRDAIAMDFADYERLVHPRIADVSMHV